MKFYYLMRGLLVGTMLCAYGVGLAKGVEQPLRLAVMPDVHFHDVYADFADGSFIGIKNPSNGKMATIRTMYAQLTSTRLFNENYFALLAALDDVRAKDIQYVIFPGDFTDDGQPVHARGFRKILDQYASMYGMQFYLTFGNHDPVGPYAQQGGKKDYMGSGGQMQPIGSVAGMYDDVDGALPPIVTSEVQYNGYQELMAELKNYGPFPKSSDLYWATPFSDYTPEDYQFDKAVAQSAYEQRQYQISAAGSGALLDGQIFTVTDASYVVEPVPGLWLLMLDSNVYVPKKDASNDGANPKNFSGSSGAGFNAIITHKDHLLNWIESIAKQADERGKVLISMTHFPAVTFDDGAVPEIEQVFGKGKMQVGRNPFDETSKVFAEKGLKLNIAGHMHFNDTGVYRGDADTFLVNIQAPSMAAYVPAYKIVTLTPETDIVDIETVVLDDVPGFDELFPLYKMEHEYLTQTGSESLWNADVLTAKNYAEFTDWHMKELTRLRFIPKDWPADVAALLLELSGADMLTLTQIPQKDWNVPNLQQSDVWGTAQSKAQDIAGQQGIVWDDLLQWNGADLAVDFHRLRNADTLAKQDITDARLKQYQLLNQLLNSGQGDGASDGMAGLFNQKFKPIFAIMDKFANDVPSDDFTVDLSTGAVTAK